MVKTQGKERKARDTSTVSKGDAAQRFAPNANSRSTIKKIHSTHKPIVVIGAGVNGSAIAMELARELKAQKSKQQVILIDLFGYPDPANIDNSSRGDTRITRMSNAEHPALTHTAIDTARFYTNLQRQFDTSSRTGIQKIATMLRDRYESTLMYKPHGFVLTMPRVGKTTPFHGHSDEHGNAYDRTLRNAQMNGVHHEVMNGHEFADRFPGFRINKADRDLTDVYYEPPCAEKDERKSKWFPTGGTLFAERSVAAQLALFEMYGGDFRPHTEVTNAVPDNGDMKVTLADGSTIDASKVVFAMNKWANPYMPTQFFQVKAQRNVVGFFKGRDMSILSSDGDNPLPSFIVYFRTKDGSADYAYGIPETKDSILYKGYFKAARENGVFGDPTMTKIMPGELNSLFNFTANFARINQPKRTKGLVCFYGVSHGGKQVWTKHPMMPNAFIVHNCDGGGFKHAVGAARPFARMILGMESNNPNINLEQDFHMFPDYYKPVHDSKDPHFAAILKGLTT